MYIMENATRVNKWLKDTFGFAPDGRPLFRIALTDQIEKRWGTYDKVTEGGLWLGRETGVFEVRKYNWFTEIKWALERLIFPMRSGMPLLPELVETSNGSYEPVHIFPQVDGKAAVPPLRAVQLLLYCLLFGPKQTLSDFMSRDENEFKKDVDLMTEQFDDASPWIPDQLRQGHGIVVPDNYIGSK